MQFKVPQFLDIEDKIFGPFTFRQFAYMAGGAGLCFVIYRTTSLIVGIIPILAIAGFSLALTFYKINNKPFIFVLEAAFSYLFRDKLYIWKRRLKKPGEKEAEDLKKSEENTENQARRVSKLGTSKLKDLAWSLDVLDVKKQ
ncbi:MAG: PrgI family protein [Candidatus Nomurabacteria bacterium]|nr:PrgI family protein [Candidatus Nomurabacteria bacterium]